MDCLKNSELIRILEKISQDYQFKLKNLCETCRTPIEDNFLRCPNCEEHFILSNFKFIKKFSKNFNVIENKNKNKKT